MSARTSAIETVGLSKTYGGEVQALVDVDLRGEQGEVFGFLGPNGAGKNTLIRILLDLIRPSAGRGALLGQDTRGKGGPARRSVGYLPGDLRLWPRATGRAELASLSALRGCGHEREIAALADRLGAQLGRPVRDLSKGNRQKIGLIQAFMHRPSLAVLEEPTSGLDPLVQETFRSLVREAAAEGRTVFLSSHSLDEVQHVAGRIGIIRAGRASSRRRATATSGCPCAARPTPWSSTPGGTRCWTWSRSRPTSRRSSCRTTRRAAVPELLRRAVGDRARTLGGWLIGIAAYIALIVAVFPSIHGSKQFDDLLKQYPDVLKSFLGIGDTLSITSGPGFVETELFSLMLPLLALVLAIGVGAATIAGEEEQGLLELVVSAPVSRRVVIGSKAAGC
jgi:ABC-type Na+ transport system ATPase subunit NatA